MLPMTPFFAASRLSLERLLRRADVAVQQLVQSSGHLAQPVYAVRQGFDLNIALEKVVRLVQVRCHQSVSLGLVLLHQLDVVDQVCVGRGISVHLGHEGLALVVHRQRHDRLALRIELEQLLR
jgi:hypothetical protein